MLYRKEKRTPKPIGYRVIVVAEDTFNQTKQTETYSFPTPAEAEAFARRFWYSDQANKLVAGIGLRGEFDCCVILEDAKDGTYELTTTPALGTLGPALTGINHERENEAGS